MKKVAPASGRLGVLLPGMGSVATTFMAGVEMVRKGWEVPIGSVTQLGLMRWGKAAKQQKIRDLIPLANLSDLIFAGWDVFSDDCYTAALKARVLNETHLESVKEFLQGIQPAEKRFSDSPEYGIRVRRLEMRCSLRQRDTQPMRGYSGPSSTRRS